MKYIPPSGNLVDWLAWPESHCISIALLFYCIYIALLLYGNNLNTCEYIVMHCIWFPWHYSPKMNALLSISDQYKTTSAINADTVHHCCIGPSCRERYIEVLLCTVQCTVSLRNVHVSAILYSALHCIAASPADLACILGPPASIINLSPSARPASKHTALQCIRVATVESTALHCTNTQ